LAARRSGGESGERCGFSSSTDPLEIAGSQSGNRQPPRFRLGALHCEQQAKTCSLQGDFSRESELRNAAVEQVPATLRLAVVGHHHYSVLREPTITFAVRESASRRPIVEFRTLRVMRLRTAAASMNVVGAAEVLTDSRCKSEQSVEAARIESV
jgi:hypothetical protein